VAGEVADDLDIAPRHAEGAAGAERLHSRFFGGKSGRKRGRGGAPAIAIRDFARREDALAEALDPTVQHVLNAPNFGGVEPETQNRHAEKYHERIAGAKREFRMAAGALGRRAGVS
jgi:hypothetical protein